VCAVLPLADVAPAAAGRLAGGGAATYNDSVSPAVDMTRRPTTHTLTPFTLAGVVSVNGVNFAGTLSSSTVTASGPSEATSDGAGTVAPFSISGTSSGVTFSGTVGGTWTRVGAAMVMQLTGTLNVCDGAGCRSASGSSLVLAGTWVPLAGNGLSPTVALAGTPISAAAFAGTFALSGNVNAAPGTPTLLEPMAGGAVNGGPGQLFTVRATDPDGDPYQATVEVTPSTGPVVTFSTAWAPSGTNSTGTPTFPFPPGTHSWRARALDPSGAAGPWSATQTFIVDAPPNFGSGEVRGYTRFTNTGGLPGATQQCTDTAFDVTVTPDAAGPADPTGDIRLSNAVVMNVGGTGYAGPIELTGTGTSGCSNATAGSGTLSLTATGRVPQTGSRVDCPSLSGTFTRVGSYVSIAVGGQCQINALVTAPVAFRADLAFRPRDTPYQDASGVHVPGLDAPVTRALFAGSFTVTPS
jgi:hypothetical protein